MLEAVLGVVLSVAGLSEETVSGSIVKLREQISAKQNLHVFAGQVFMK